MANNGGDWWYTSIGGYDDILGAVSRADTKGGCGSCTRKQIEGFDGISDDQLNKIKTENAPTTISETQSEMGAPIDAPTVLGTQTHVKEIIHHRYIDHESGSEPERPSRRSRSPNWRGSRDLEDRAYNGYNGGDFGYNYIPVPVPVEVPVYAPPVDNGENHTYGLVVAMIPVAFAVMVGALLISLSRRK